MHGRDKKICIFYSSTALVSLGLHRVEVSRLHSRHATAGRVIVPWQRQLPDDNTQHFQETDIHAPGGIRIHNPRQRAAADPRLTPRGHL